VIVLSPNASSVITMSATRIRSTGLVFSGRLGTVFVKATAALRRIQSSSPDMPSSAVKYIVEPTAARYLGSELLGKVKPSLSANMSLTRTTNYRFPPEYP
jgi:hypothetical protein